MSLFSSCSVACGGGTCTRTRVCIDPLFGGAECDTRWGRVRRCATRWCAPSPHRPRRGVLRLDPVCGVHHVVPAPRRLVPRHTPSRCRGGTPHGMQPPLVGVCESRRPAQYLGTTRCYTAHAHAYTHTHTHNKPIIYSPPESALGHTRCTRGPPVPRPLPYPLLHCSRQQHTPLFFSHTLHGAHVLTPPHTSPLVHKVTLPSVQGHETTQK